MYMAEFSYLERSESFVKPVASGTFSRTLMGQNPRNLVVDAHKV